MKRKYPGVGVFSFCLLFAVLFSQPAAAADLPKNVAIGTPSVGSAPYVVSVGIAEMITKKAGIPATAESAGGADATTRLLRDGHVQLGVLTSFAATHGFRGDRQFEEGYVPIRALVWGSDSLRQPVVRKSSGIKSISDFAGKRILARRKVGADTELTFNGLIKAYGLTPKQVKVLTYSKPKEIADALIAGTADGAVWASTAPNPLIMQLQESVDLGYPSVPKDKWEAVLKELGPAFFMSTVKANTYKNQPEEIYVPAIHMGICTTKNFSEEAVYRIAKVIFGNYEELKSFHPSAREWTVQTTLQQFCIPFHEGAVRYFKELGVWTPEHEKKQQAVLKEEGK